MDFNNTFRIIRISIFGVTCFLAFIVLILGGLVVSWLNKDTNGDTELNVVDGPPSLAIATAILTLLSLPAMIALSMFRKGAFTSMIAVEIGWTWFLWIMWIAVGASSVDLFADSCDLYQFAFGQQGVNACNDNKGIIALAFLNWICLLFYKVFLTGLTFRQYLRGNTRVWVMDVTETDFASAGSTTTTQVVYDGKVNPTYGNQYPPGTPTPLGQPQVVYSQAGSFAQPQTQTGASPYPQV